MSAQENTHTDITFKFSLRAHLYRLQQRGEIKRIGAPVDPELELAAVVRRMVQRRDSKSALLFGSVRGSKWPVLTNLFSSHPRIAALVSAGKSTALSDLSSNIDNTVSSFIDFTSWLGRQPRQLPQLDPAPPMDILPGLSELPAVKVWPEDAGAYLSMAVVICRSLDATQTSCGLYRVQLHDEQRATIHWRPGSDGARLFADYQLAGIAMPVAIVMGCAPALTYAAAFPLPFGCDEFNFAAFLQHYPISFTEGEVTGLPIPYPSEFVLEGEIKPENCCADGPFGNHQGFYSAPLLCPVFDLKRLTARGDAIFPATIIGPAPSESSTIGTSFMEFLLPLLRREVPQLIDIYMPRQTVFHGCALIRLQVDSMVEQVKKALLKAPLLAHSRLVVFVDREIDVTCPEQVLWRVLNQPLEQIVGLEMGRVVVDATRWNRERRQLLLPDTVTEKLIDKRWREYGLDEDWDEEA